MKHEIIVIILCLSMVLRLPSLFEPHWYGDEEVYLTIAQSLNRGAKLYKEIHDNKPPFLYLVAAAAAGQLFWFKLITAGISLVAIGFFWLLAQDHFDRPRAIVATGIFSALNTLPLIEGNVANAEMFFVAFTLIAFVLISKNKNLFLAGLIMGLGAMFKIPALLDVGVWPLFWLITQQPNWFKKSTLLVAGALLPLAISIGFYAANGSLNNYLIAAGLQNIPYLSSWQAVNGFWGTLFGRAATAAMLVLLVGFAGRHLGKNRVLVLLWFIVTLFAGLLSGRPYPHYLLQLSPAFALLFVKTLWGKPVDRYLGLTAGLLLTGVIVLFKFYAYPVVSYYKNFLSWSTGKIDTATYYNFFNHQVNNNYKIAREVMAGSQPDEKIFVWGDEPSIYALSRRQPAGKYTVAYHIFDFRAQETTIKGLAQNPPRYIIVFLPPDQLPGLRHLLSKSYILTGSVGNAKIYRRPNMTAWNLP